MIVDSPALIAISRGDPESAVCFRALLDSPSTRLSAAKDLDEALLFIGRDFIHTDIRPALT